MFECPECGHLHDDPSDARLGFVVLCLDCAIAIEIVETRYEFFPAA